MGLEARERRPPTSEELQRPLQDVRARFLAAVRDIRPRLHRFCSRMSGSALDGEDLVQETLAQAFYSLTSLKDDTRLEAWLFRIAHNKCVDFARRERRQWEDTVPYDDEELAERLMEDVDHDAEPIDRSLATFVTGLPAMERACVLLKDVLDFRLSEVAEIVGSTTGAVKSALHRGRLKLRRLSRPPAPVELEPSQRQLLQAYIACFNRRDWDGLRRLIQADARVEVVGEAEFAVLDIGAPYFSNYAALPWQWRLSLAYVDSEPLIVHWRKVGEQWRPLAAIRLWWRDGKVARIRDYAHVEYLLNDARVDADPQVVDDATP
ncbi:MAG TPA: sigma-70 family RNA polymerase sigma factor [Gemmatimonadales bacterium]|nr:sigma-70 family RNA polymerase sigma factor [Gemmatimonadales bacterium]